jgi:hypothetical protein
MEDIIATSPDLEHRAELRYAGEIRFGPAYYSLVLDTFRFRDRVFGKACLWSPDSRFFAVQEWETTIEGHGPQTRLLMIDLKTSMEGVLSRAENGFIVPKSFEGTKLIYMKEFFAPHSTREFEIEFPSLKRWENLK